MSKHEIVIYPDDTLEGGIKIYDIEAIKKQRK
jgi:hypothetical protein